MPEAAIDEALIGALYGTALAEGNWRPALERLRTLLDSAETSLVQLSDNLGLRQFETTGRVLDLEVAGGYVAYYGRLDPKRPILAAGGPGYLFNDADHFGDDFVARDPFYQEYSRRLGTRHTLDLCLRDASGQPMYLAAMRSGGQGCYDRGAELLFRRASVHFCRALALKEKLDTARQAGEALDRLRLGVVVLDSSRRVQLANRAATEWIARSATLRLCCGELSARTADDVRRLDDLVAAALAGRGSSARFSSSAGGNRLFWSVPLDDRVVVCGAQAGAVMLVFGEASRRPLDARSVAARHGLTEAEARVAVALAQGETLQAIARRHGVKYSTVRSQLASVLQKLGVHRQAEVARLLLSAAQSAPV